MASLLEIKKYPDSVLRGKSEEIKEITPEIMSLGFDMVETMVASQGLGLAAPQVGELKRLIVIEGEEKPQILINPKILNSGSKTEILEEGCLSFPELFLKIKRPKEIEVEFRNLQGEKIKVKATGMLARVIQHEIDHLDGILILDKIGFWQRLKIRNKINRPA